MEATVLMSATKTMGSGPFNTTAGLVSMSGMSDMPESTGSSSMSGMMGMGSMGSCKIDMLWNWYTIDACFLSSSWKITSRGMFAGSCIAVICLVLCLEALRRLGREYDTFILRRARQRHMYLRDPPPSENREPLIRDNALKESGLKSCLSQKSPQTNDIDDPDRISISPSPEAPSEATPSETRKSAARQPLLSNGPAREEFHHRPSPVEQVVRALLHTFQFGVAYIVMLLAMYYNGYIIICIFIGAFLGSLIFSWEQVSLNKPIDACQVTKCCG